MLVPSVLMSNFRINVLEARDIWFFISCDFCQPVISHPVYMVSSCSPPDSDPSLRDILNLADVANVFVAMSSIPRVLPVIHLELLIPVVASS